MNQVKVDLKEVTWENKTYKISQVEFEEVFSKVEDHLRKQRRSPIETIIAEHETLSKHPELQQKFIDRAYEDLVELSKPVPQEKIMRWIDSFDGFAFLLWLGVVKNHPEVKYEQAKKMFLAVGAAEAKKMRDEMMKKEVEKVKNLVGEEAWEDLNKKADEMVKGE